MEIAAISGIHHVVEPPSTPAKYDSNISQKLTIINIDTEPTVTCRELVNKEDILQKDVAGENKSLPITLKISKNVEKATLAVLPTVSNNSKPVRLKTSDKLTKVIETCKKLQKLSDQNANNKKNCETVSELVSATVQPPETANGVTTITDVSSTVPELSPNLSILTSDELSLLSDHAESHSSSSSSSASSFDSFNLSHSANNSPVSGSQHTSESNLKRFLFLFRPSDHEVLVRNKGVNMYRCNVCGGMYRQKFSLKRHFLRSHINFQYISQSDISNCKIAVPNDYVPQDMNLDCDKAPHSRKKFKSSNAIFFENNEARVMPGLYTCHICVGVNFDLEQELRDHYNTHSDAERKKFQCDKCSASFFKKQILSRHLASHGEKVVRKECRRCGAQFSSKSEYQKHLISHSSGRVCKYCSKILSTSANRKRHEALHLGLKPYRCTHCGMCFAQSKDLDRHLRKQHSGICHFCEACNKLFPSQASLDVHLHDKHSDPSPTKKIENTTSPEHIDKPCVSSPEPVPQETPIKLKVCIVCKRSFPTFYAMMKHRTQAHPYYTKRRRRKTMKQKLAQQAAAQEGIKVRKPYGKRVKHNHTFPTSTVRRGRPPLDRSVKFGSPSYRPGSRWMTKRDRELAKKEEIEFYFSLSEKIAENLLHYVDGKTPQLSLKAYTFNERFPPCNFEERGRFPWSNYNFPIGYDVDKALTTRGQEVRNKVPENLSSRDKCLYATGLNSVQKLSEMSKNVVNDNLTESNTNILETLRIQVNGINIKKLNLEERKKLIGRKVLVVCLCYVCKENFESNEAFKAHCINNHPNVDCSCIEIEGNMDSPPVIPGDLCKQNVTADGIFFSWNVPPPLSETSLLKCTKCKFDFKSSLELHSHIVKCGNLRSSPSHVWKFTGRKRIKRTMRYRMSLAEQQAALDAHNKDYKTPEKFSYGRKESIAKSNEKVAKSTEKSQFYKSGRLQTTTSFTVDMNYFKTKPVKPVNTQPSKRGRKSYATLSYRYKNASMQSTSIQCAHCKEIFNSQSALNIHLQCRCANSQSKRIEKVQAMANKAILNVPPAHTASLRKSFQFSNKLANNSTWTSLPLSNADISLQSKYNNTLNVDVPKFDMVENPMDLSRNSNDSASLNIDISYIKSNNASKKSALEIAMAAVQEYSQTSEQNEHISYLQKSLEKLTSPNPAAQSLTKSLSAKKVGRPKKVKRLGPFKFRKNLFQDSIASSDTITSKPVSNFSESIVNKDVTQSKFPEYIEKVITSSRPTSKFPESITTKDATLSNPALEFSELTTKEVLPSKFASFPESIAKKDAGSSKPASHFTESIPKKDAVPSESALNRAEPIVKKDAMPSKSALNIAEPIVKKDAMPSKSALNIAEPIIKKDAIPPKFASNIAESVSKDTTSSKLTLNITGSTLQLQPIAKNDAAPSKSALIITESILKKGATPSKSVLNIIEPIAKEDAAPSKLSLIITESISKKDATPSKSASNITEFIAKKDATLSKSATTITESITDKDTEPSKSALNITESIGKKDATPLKFSLNITEHIAEKNATHSKSPSNITEPILKKDVTPSKSALNITESIAKKDATPSICASNITESIAKKDSTPSKSAANITESIARKDVTPSKSSSKLEEAVKRLTKNKGKPDSAHSKEAVSAFKTVGAAIINISGKESNTLSTLSSMQPTYTPVKVVNKEIVKIPISTFNPATNLNLGTTGNFVPILIYGDKNKPINVLRLTNSQSIKSISLTQTISKNSSDSSSLTNVSKVSENSSSANSYSTPEKTLKYGGNTSVDNNSNSNSPSKKSDETRRTSGSQGRISPSLESIVNSIKQKLHSQESSPQDDVAVSWLEDEKFEIPSRPKLMLPTDSGSNSPVSIDNETFVPISVDSSLSYDHEKSNSVVLPQNNLVLPQNTVETTSNHIKNVESSQACPPISIEAKADETSVVSVTEILSSENIPEMKHEENVLTKILSSENILEMEHEENVLPNKIEAQIVKNELKSFRTSKIKHRKKRSSLFTFRKIRTLKTNAQKTESVQKKAVRSKNKNPVNTADSDINKNSSSSNAYQPKTEIKDTSSPPDTVPIIEIAALSVLQAEFKDQISEQNINLNDSKNLSNAEKTSFSKSEDHTDCHQELSMTTVECSELPKLSISSTDIPNVQSEDLMTDSKMSNLRAFRTKVKQLMSSSEASPSVETPITTEFGRNLASRMKEKMRLSFENASLENLIKSDEGNNTDAVPDPSLSDTNSQISDDDSEYLRAIKKEVDSSEPTKKHSCPFCKLEFAYLTNFRRHLKLCRSRNLIKEIEPVPSTSNPVLQYLPKKDEVEHSMLNLLRHQSRQTQMLKEAEKKTGSTIENNFRSYSCNVCHRIYLSLFKLLQHQVTHKLSPKNALEQNSELDYAKAMENFSVSDLEEKGLHVAEIGKDIDTNNTEVIKQIEAEKSLQEKLKINKDQDHLTNNGTGENIDNSPDDNVKNPSSVNFEVQDKNIIAEVAASKIPGDIKVSVKIEEQPAKRKRGRPVGWRKNANIAPANQPPKPVRSFRGYNKTKSIVLGIKNKTVNSSALKRGRKEFTIKKSNIKTEENAIHRKKKIVSLKQFEFTADDELPPIPVPLNEGVGSKLLESKPSVLEDRSTNTNKQKQKNILKRTYKKKVAITNITLEDVKPVLPRSPQKLLVKTLPNSSPSKTNLKLKHSKVPALVTVKTEPVDIEEEFPLKRKPGRPAKNLQGIPSTSKSKGFSKPSNTRTLQKMISRGITIYSSDSDDEGIQEEANPKKKILHLKPCLICKEKFSASLALYRHMQLVHNRQSNLNALKVESPQALKLSKQVSPKSSVRKSADESKILKGSNPKSIVMYEKDDLEAPKMVDICSPVPEISAGKSKVSKRSPKLLSVSTKTEPSANSLKKPKRGFSKLSDDHLSDLDCSVISKKDDKSTINSKSGKATVSPIPDNLHAGSPKSFKTNNATSNAISSKPLKKVAKSILDDNSDGDSIKGTNKMDVNTSAKRGRIPKKVFVKPVLDSNSDNDSVRSFKQSVNKSNSPKFVKRINAMFVASNDLVSNFDKSSKIGSIITKRSRGMKRGNAKLITDDSSDVDSIKSVTGANSPKTVKKICANLLKEDNSDSDSIKSFTPHLAKRTVSAYSSDSETVKVFRKANTKSLAVFNSEAKGPRGPRKAIPKFMSIDNSDCDSDISIKTDVTPMRNLKACSVCKQNFPGALHLCHHVKLMHSSGESVSNTSIKPDLTSLRNLKACSICKKSFPGALHLRRHMKLMHSSGESVSDTSVKTDVTPLKNLKACPICKDNFSGALHLRRHMKLIHSNDESVSDTSVKIDLKPSKNLKACSICKENFPGAFHLRRHIKLKHSSDKSVSDTLVKTDVIPFRNLKACSICKKNFPGALHLRRHMKLMHSSSESEDTSLKTHVTPLRNLKACSICKENFPGALHLRHHMKLMHSSSESVSDTSLKTVAKLSKVCPICKESFSGGQFHIRRHIRTMHCSDSDNNVSAKSSVTTLKCLPSQLLMNSSDAVSGKTNASPLRHYGICPICKQKFSTKSDLCQHMQLFHSRKSDPGLEVSSISPMLVTTPSPKSHSSMRTALDDAASRGALSRQCRKPLPLFKRKRSKKNLPSHKETKNKLT